MECGWARREVQGFGSKAAACWFDAAYAGALRACSMSPESWAWVAVGHG